MGNLTDLILRLNPFVPQCNGMTVWTPWKTYVLIGSWLHGEERARVERHEKKHCEQILALGIARFAAEYAAEYVRVGRYNNKFEIEARASEGQ
jgi:hypothetical protein